MAKVDTFRPSAFTVSSSTKDFPSCFKTAPNASKLQLDGDGFDFRVVRQPVFAEFAADARLLVAAKWRGRVEHVITIYPNRAGAYAIGDGMSLGDVLGPDRCGKAIKRLIGALNDPVEILEFQDGHDRTEDFFLRDLHVVFNIGEDGGLDEVALVAHALAARQQF